jgi:hypothetical protein
MRIRAHTRHVATVRHSETQDRPFLYLPFSLLIYLILFFKSIRISGVLTVLSVLATPREEAFLRQLIKNAVLTVLVSALIEKNQQTAWSPRPRCRSSARRSSAPRAAPYCGTIPNESRNSGDRCRRLTRIEHFVHQNSPDKEGHMAVLATDGPAFEWQVPRAAPTG